MLRFINIGIVVGVAVFSLYQLMLFIAENKDTWLTSLVSTFGEQQILDVTIMVFVWFSVMFFVWLLSPVDAE